MQFTRSLALKIAAAGLALAGAWRVRFWQRRTVFCHQSTCHCSVLDKDIHCFPYCLHLYQQNIFSMELISFLSFQSGAYGEKRFWIVAGNGRFRVPYGVCRMYGA